MQGNEEMKAEFCDVSMRRRFTKQNIKHVVFNQSLMM
jgi:hypothetical protein